MILFVLGITLILILIARYTVTDKISRIIILLYLLWWMVWLVLSTLDIYGLFSVSFQAYGLLLLNLFMFLLGYLVGSNEQNKADVEIKQVIHIDMHNNKVFNIILGINFLILGYYFINYLYLSTILPTDQLRIIRFTVGPLFRSTQELLLFNYFVEAFVYFLYAVIAYMIVKREMLTVTFIVSLLSLVFFAGIGSGRGPIIYLLVAIVLMYFLVLIFQGERLIDNGDEQEGKQFKKSHKASIFFVLAAFPPLLIYASWLTAIRLGITEFNFEGLMIGVNELIKQFVVYFNGPFRALDYAIINYAPELPYFWGQATFAGVNEILYSFFHLIGIEITNINYIIADYLQNNAILVGRNIFLNYSYTNTTIHYFDFGVFGVIIFPLLLGFLVRKTIFLFYRRPTLPALILMVLLFQVMIFSVFNWVLQAPSTLLVIFICLIWHWGTLKYEDYNVESLE